MEIIELEKICLHCDRYSLEDCWCDKIGEFRNYNCRVCNEFEREETEEEKNGLEKIVWY